MFDEEPEGDPHGECANEIHDLQAERDALNLRLKCNCPSPCNAPACLLKALEQEREKVKDRDLQVSELKADMEQRQQVLVDFARENFGEDEGKTWEAPFTVEKFIEMVGDEMTSLYAKVSDLQGEQRLQVEMARKILDAKDAWIKRATEAEALLKGSEKRKGQSRVSTDSRESGCPQCGAAGYCECK